MFSILVAQTIKMTTKNARLSDINIYKRERERERGDRAGVSSI